MLVYCDLRPPGPRPCAGSARRVRFVPMPVPVRGKPLPGCGNPQPALFGPDRSRSIDLEWSLSAVRVVERTYEGAARVEGLLLGPLHEEEVDDPVDRQSVV